MNMKVGDKVLTKGLHNVGEVVEVTVEGRVAGVAWENGAACPDPVSERVDSLEVLR